MKIREICEIANVPSLTKLEEKVHKSDTLGLESATVELFLKTICKHAFQSISAKSLRTIRLFDCSILDLSQTNASKFLGCLVPREKLDENIVRRFVIWILSNSRRLNLEHCLKPALRWINCVLKHGICSVDKLQIAYELFFQILGIGTVRPFVLDILFKLTANKKELVTRRRAKILLKLMKKDNSVRLLSLLTRFTDLKPDVATENLPKKGSAIRKTKSRIEETFGAIWSEKQTETETNSSKIEDFKQKLAQLKQVGQSMSLLDTPPQSILYLAISSTQMQERFSFTLYYTLYNEFFSMTQSTKNKKRKLDLLCRINRLQEYCQQGLPVVGRFLAQFLSTWDGEEYFVEICKMMSFLQLTEKQELEECILQPLGILFNSKLSCIHQLLILNYLGRLAQHWAVMEYERFKSFCTGPFPMSNAQIHDGPLDSITGLTESITEMAETGLSHLIGKIEDFDLHRLHVNTYIQETLSIFRTITRCFILFEVPIRPKLPESIIYFSLFGRNPAFVSESLEYMTMIKHETIPMIMRVCKDLYEDDDTLGYETASKQLDELNDLNVLVKDSLAILSTDTHLLIRGESIFRKEWALDDDLIRHELSLNSHVVFLPYVIKYITEETANLQELSDTGTDSYKDYFKMLKQHLPRVTEFLDTFGLKVVENYDIPNSSQSLECSIDGSIEAESGISSMA